MNKGRQLPAILMLEDRKVFYGTHFGAIGETTGEVIFNTSMTGYQEVLTDPSYRGQIVTMTYPLIGNYGINEQDFESSKPYIAGFVIKECSKIFSNWRAQKSLDTFLKEYNIIGIEGIDTRALTKHIRTAGAMKAIISTIDFNRERLIKKVKEAPGLIGRDLVKEVTCKKIHKFKCSNVDNYSRDLGSQTETQNVKSDLLAAEKLKVVVIDCGVKYNILRELQKNNCEIIIVPANTQYETILDLKPEGILLSNGPGDPEGVPYVVNTVKKLITQCDHIIPIFGICLGHQILGLAFGGKTYKLKFGHHGGNHPVKDLKTGKIAITVQNHGFCVDINSLNKEDIEITHINLNDNTLEGMRHKKLPIFSVQFHPEASPGPHDTNYLFREFIELIQNSKHKIH